MAKGRIWVGKGQVIPAEGTRPALRLDIWLDPELGVVAHDLSELGEGDLGRLLATACREPLVGRPRRPARVRVESRELAVEVERARLGVVVDVAPVSELDGLLEQMMSTPEPEPLPAHDTFGGAWRPPSRADLAKAKKVARRFFAARPWARFGPTDEVEVRAPSLGLAQGFVLVIGGGDEPLGFVVCATVADLRRFEEAQLTDPAQREGRPPLDGDILVFDATPDQDGEDGDGGEMMGLVMRLQRDWRTTLGAGAELRLCLAIAEALMRVGPGRARVEVGPVTLSVREAGPVVVLPRGQSGAGEKPDGGGGRRSRWGELSDRMYPKMLAWARQRFADWDAHMAEMERHLGRELLASSLSFVLPLSPDGPTLGEAYRVAEGERLSATERRWLDANIETAWTSLWSVVDVDPGRAMTLRDIFTEERRTVIETRASRMAGIHDLACARVVTVDGESYLDAAHPRVLGPRAVPHFRRELGSRLGLTKVKAVPVDKMRAPRVALGLVTAWQKVVAESDAASSAIRMQNTDGEALVMVTERYALRAPRAKVEGALRAIRGIEAPARGETTWILTKEGNAKIKEWETTNIASLRIERDTLVVETNSRERSAHVGGLLKAALGSALGPVTRAEQDGSELMREAALAPAGPRLVEVPPPEVQAAIAEMKRRAYASWADEPLDALGGKTARQAAKSAAGRQKVATILDEMERLEAREVPGARFDVDTLRRELGLR